jgi:DNA mismatch endonuclease (patch repair protein)
MASVLPVPSSLGVSARMSKQRRRDTGPEMAVRRLLHRAGLRYRVAWPIPGIRRRTVDIAFPRRRIAVFVDGCFWHGCPDHKGKPAANSAWWAEKLAKNKARDELTTAALVQRGWTVVRVWEHDDAAEAAERIIRLVAEARGNDPVTGVASAD